jgi:hypothetical protein
MKSSKARLALGVTAAGLLCAAPAIATVMAYRQTALGCIPTSSAGFKIVTPSAVPGADWGVINSTATVTSPDQIVYCPMGMDVSVSDAALSQPLLSVQVLYSSTPGVDVKCTYYLLDNAGGGAFTSPDMSGNSGGMTSVGFLTTAPPPGTVQLANSAQTRQLFTCILPKATQPPGFPPPVTIPNAILKAFEVRYGQ